MTMQTKELHHHATPIIVLTVGLFLLSVLALSQLLIGAGARSNNSLVMDLSERLLTIKPSSNGLLKITRYQAGQTNADQLTSSTQKQTVSETESTGEVTILTTNLQSLQAMH